MTFLVLIVPNKKKIKSSNFDMTTLQLNRCYQSIVFSNRIISDVNLIELPGCLFYSLH